MLQHADRIQVHQDPGQDAKKDPHVLDYDFQAIGPALRVMQLNLDGLSRERYYQIYALGKI